MLHDKIFTREYLSSTIEKAINGFEADELAYLSVQCKNELQIRDKIAWLIHKDIGNKYVIRREFAPDNTSKQRIDLAVFELNESKTEIKEVVALIEFKAHSIARPEKWYVDEFVHDIEKMKQIVEKDKKTYKNTDLYFVLLETIQGHKPNDGKYKHTLGFNIYVNEKTKFYSNYDSDDDLSDNLIKEDFVEFTKQEIIGHYKKNDHVLKLAKKFSIPKLSIIPIGEAFGYKEYVAPLILGPIKSSDITIETNE